MSSSFAPGRNAENKANFRSTCRLAWKGFEFGWLAYIAIGLLNYFLNHTFDAVVKSNESTCATMSSTGQGVPELFARSSEYSVVDRITSDCGGFVVAKFVLGAVITLLVFRLIYVGIATEKPLGSKASFLGFHWGAALLVITVLACVEHVLNLMTPWAGPALEVVFCFAIPAVVSGQNCWASLRNAPVHMAQNWGLWLQVNLMSAVLVFAALALVFVGPGLAIIAAIPAVFVSPLLYSAAYVNITQANESREG